MTVCFPRLEMTRGISLTEVMMTLAGLSCVAAVAVPSMLSMVHTSRLRGAAESMASQLRLTMTESLKRQLSVSITVSTGVDAGDWCYGRSVDSACKCTQEGSCVVDGVEQVVSSLAFPGVSVLSGVSGNRFSTQPRRSTVTAGNVLFTAANGKQLKVVVSGYGRIRICSPAGTAKVGGYPTC
jgi:type IV fimbrial biogenesis protein FimT